MRCSFEGCFEDAAHTVTADVQLKPESEEALEVTLLICTGHQDWLCGVIPEGAFSIADPEVASV